MNTQLVSYLYVAVQLAAIGFIVCTGPILASQLWCQVVEVGGLALGAWAVATMGLRQLRAAPDVAAQARLVVNGPYRWIRHPMYSSVLLGAGAMSSMVDPALGWSLWSGLALVLFTKSALEERWMRQEHPAYASYARTTKRFVPWIF